MRSIGHEVELDSFVNELANAGVYRVVLSGSDANSKFRRAVLSKAANGYHVERLTATQAFHANIALEELPATIVELFDGFKQINAWDLSYEYTLRRTKKGKLLTGKHPKATAPAERPEHDRSKKYLIKEGTVVAPLVDMGVMDSLGRVNKPMQGKFRQINRFLEIIDDVVSKRNYKSITIVDFACGKSYLTFIVYHYFACVLGIPVRMLGIDLKSEVIEYCAQLAKKYGYDGLEFCAGDIADFAADGKVDIVLSLHACDTATDYALLNAVKCGAEHILSVPCCQHELNQQADYSSMPLFDSHGIVRERFSALLTDSIRAQLLTASGYNANIMEFVDLCHTPKNLLIRASKAHIPAAKRMAALRTVVETCKTHQLSPTLLKLLSGNGLLGDTEG